MCSRPPGGREASAERRQDTGFSTESQQSTRREVKGEPRLQVRAMAFVLSPMHRQEKDVEGCPKQREQCVLRP